MNDRLTGNLTSMDIQWVGEASHININGGHTHTVASDGNTLVLFVTPSQFGKDNFDAPPDQGSVDFGLSVSATNGVVFELVAASPIYDMWFGNGFNGPAYAQGFLFVAENCPAGLTTIEIHSSRPDIQYELDSNGQMSLLEEFSGVAASGGVLSETHGEGTGPVITCGPVTVAANSLIVAFYWNWSSSAGPSEMVGAIQTSGADGSEAFTTRAAYAVVPAAGPYALTYTVDVPENQLDTAAVHFFLVALKGHPNPCSGESILPVLTGPFRWKPKLAIRDLYNGVKGTYISPTNNWQAADIPAYAQDEVHGYVSDANMAADGGDRRWLDIQLPFTISAATAQRIAKIELLRRRQQGTGTFGLNMVGYQLTALDIIAVSLPYFNWKCKLLEVLAHRFKLDKQNVDGVDVTVLGTEMDVQESDPGIYEWNESEELTPQGYQQAVVPSINNPAPPTLVTLRSDQGTASYDLGGTSHPRILVSWTAPADGYVLNGGCMELQYADSLDEPSWTSIPLLPSTQTSYYISPVTEYHEYNVRIRSVNTANVPSEWVYAGPVEAGLVPALPPDAAGSALACEVLYIGASFRWQPSLTITVIDLNTSLVNYQIQTYTDASKAVVITAWGTYINAGYPALVGVFPALGGALQPVTGAAEYVDMRAQFLNARGDATYSNVVDANVGTASAQIPLPITSFALTVEIEGAADEGGGIFSISSEGFLVRVGDSTRKVGAALPLAQSFQAHAMVGMPDDPVTHGVYLVYAKYSDATFDTLLPSTGFGWLPDYWGVVATSMPPKGAIYEDYTGWIQLEGTPCYQKWSARTFNWDATPTLGMPDVSLIQKVQFPAALPNPVEILCSVSGKPAASALVLLQTLTQTLSFMANFWGSVGSVGVNPTATATFTVEKNGATIGSIVVSTAGVLSFSTVGEVGYWYAPGDRLTMTAPSPQDATLADVAITLAGRR